MANAKPSFSPEDLEAIIKSNPEMLAKIFAAMNKTAKQDRDDSKIVNAFLKAGYKDVVLLDMNRSGIAGGPNS
jgi:hypothetical protein